MLLARPYLGNNDSAVVALKAPIVLCKSRNLGGVVDRGIRRIFSNYICQCKCRIGDLGC